MSVTHAHVGRRPDPQAASGKRGCGCAEGPARGMPRYLRPPLQARRDGAPSADPLEREADVVAEAAASAHPAPRVALSPVPPPPAGAPTHSGGACPACAAARTVQADRGETSGGQSSAGAVDHALTSHGDGAPLPPRLRGRVEAVVGRDLSAVRVHQDATAARAADSIAARAFTAGRHIYLGSGQRADDLRLMAHEAAHTVQQADGAAEPVQRKPLDPASAADWSNMSPEFRRDGSMQGTFLDTLGAATEASMTLHDDIEQAGSPQSDDERARFAARAQTLVRLNALGMMASHRATIEGRQQEMLRSLADRTAPEGEFDREVPGRDATLARIRETATKVHQLQTLREELDGYRSDLAIVNGRALISSSSASNINDLYNTIADSAAHHNSVRIRNYLRSTARTVFGERRSGDELRLFAWGISGYLERWRQGQINGIDLALGKLYEAYPFFSELDAEDFADGDYADDAALERAVRASYQEMLHDIDDAIVEIGSGDIHPFDLPEAVAQTRGGLPEGLRGEFDTVLSDHALTEFWWTLGLTFAQVALVFVPVVGPALAAGVGLLDLAMQAEGMLDEWTLSDAATNPQGELLGVGGPGTLDWAMLAVTAILTAADLGMVAKEFRAARGAMALDALRLGEGQLDELTGLIDDLALDPVDVGRLGSINDETLEMFQRRPDLLQALSDNPVVARILKHCASPCWPENLESWAVDYLGDFIDDVGQRGLSLGDLGVSESGLHARLAEAGSDGDVTAIFNTLEEKLAIAENRAYEGLRGTPDALAHGGESVRGTGGAPNDRIINEHLAGDVHPSGVPFSDSGHPQFPAEHRYTLPEEMRGPATPDEDQFVVATAHLRDSLHANPALRERFTAGQLEDIEAVRPRIRGLTWHHHEDGETLELVDAVLHRRTGHTGGRAAAGGRHAPL